MAGYAPDEEIELFEVSQWSICISCIIISMIAISLKCNTVHLMLVHIQEIKFEPNVMCEHVDKKSTFRENQV